MEAITKLKRIKFIMLTGESLHKYGASSDRIEKALMLLAEKLDLKAQFLASPTSLLASFKITTEREYTRLRRLDVGKVNLSKLLFIDGIVDKMLDESIEFKEASLKIHNVVDYPHIYKGIVIDFAYAMISFNIAIIIGGNFYDAILSGLLGFVIGLFTETIKIDRLSSIADGVLAFLTAICAVLIPHYTSFPMHPHIITISSLIILMPGLMLTTSVSELASNNLLSGASRLLGAIVILLKISFGVYLANILARNLHVSIETVAHLDKSIYLKTLLIPLTALGFTISFQARFKEYYWICTACVLTFITSRVTLEYLGFAMSSFTAGAFIASFSNLFSRISKKPALITLLPGITLLVPGALGFTGIEAMMNEHTIEGINSLLRTFITAIALVTGTIFGSILVKPKRVLDV